MSDDGLPRVETRRAREFAAELVARARTWLPGWNPDDDQSDPGRALLEVSARLLAQVAERLDRVAEKNRRNLYAWLGLRGLAARGARLPVVFKLSDSVIANADPQASVLASAPVQLQADAAGTSLVFETDADLRLVPARVALVAAVDPSADAWYLPAAGFGSLEPAPLLPASWEVVSLAAPGSALLQLDPPLGLAPGMIIEVLGSQFSITSVNADIVGLAPKIDIAGGIAAGSVATRVDDFAPFDGTARTQQAHALYIGHPDLFNIESTARIEIVGAQALASGPAWQYWGKAPGSDADDWQALAVIGTTADALVLEKQTLGAIDPLPLAGVPSRWLRAAVAGALPAGAQPLSFADLHVRVGSAAQPSRPPLEGLANTNPLVLETAFLPLGREPRQFDAFYLGCTEVFAKHGARVSLDLAIADSSFSSLSALRDGLIANRILAGIARDASLHLLGFDPGSGAIATLPQRDALQPPGPGAAGRVPLDKQPAWRVPIWYESPLSVLVAVTAGRSVWIWREVFGIGILTVPSGWIVPGGPPIPATGSSSAKIDALVRVDDGTPGTLHALFDGALYTRAALSTTAWAPVALTPAKKLKMLAPVAAGAGTLHLVGVDDLGALFAVHDDGTLAALLPAGSAAADLQPIALRRASDGHLVVVATDPAHGALVAIDHTTATTKVTTALTLPAPQLVLGLDFDDAVEGSSVIVSAAGGGVSRVLWWSPDPAAAATQSVAIDAPLAAAAGTLSGVPLRQPHHVLTPGDQATVFELPLLAAGGASAAPLQLWAQLPPLASSFGINDTISVDRDGITGLATVTQAAVIAGGARWLPLELASTPANLPATMTGFYTSGTALGATIDAQHATSTDILLDGPTDLDSTTKQILVTSGTTPALFDVGLITPGGGPAGETLVVITPKLPAAPTTITYFASVDLSGGSTATVLRFDQALAGPPTLSPPDLALLLLAFPGALPAHRRADVLTRLPDGRPAAALLESSWTTPPVANAAGEIAYSIEAEPGAWVRTLGTSDSNPELSWEYSNGRSWWQLKNLTDATNRLKTSGTVQFDVPDDIAASDWAGRTNFWIRARLIGGDYGKEVFTVTATTNGNVTTQSVTRSTQGVLPPVVVSIDVTYRMDDAVYPEQLIAEDAGTQRQQADANRTPGALVEAFVPLDVELARLTGGAAAGAAAAPCCPPVASPCLDGTSEARAVAAVAPAAGGGGAALMIGLEGAAVGAPVQLLLAVGAEHDFDDNAPLKVEALVGGRFEPVVAQDATRAIGESGVVTMAIAHAPGVTELFGRALSWLRLSPANTAGWTPSLAGAWINAAWVEAAQTQTFEILGSAQGEPGLVVTLARPPLLHDTLELRVNEPLGDEEVAALRVPDAGAVLTEVDGLPGQWVRWSAVDDVADAAPGERVYMLDEASGDVTFGDGTAGMIPPIGRDNIVAFKYRRTEPLKPAAPDAPPPQVAIAALSSLGLVTPLEGVEAAIAALDSDAGAPADDAARVLRFAPARLRHRGRALSAADVEALALQAMPAIAQARCITGGAVLRLVVVMRGRQIAPARAVQRELERLLLAALPAGFNEPGSGLVLVIAPPVPRLLRVRAELRVASLDVAGAVADAASQALRQHLDPATGADDGLGWPLGAAPDKRELAAALIDTPALDGIETLDLFEITAGGAEAPWPATLDADELAVLAADGIAFTYLLPTTAP